MVYKLTGVRQVDYALIIHSCKTTFIQINSFLKTTKKEEELHGFGLRSVKRIIHEREGYMKIKILGEQFRIILYLNGFSN